MPNRRSTWKLDLAAGPKRSAYLVWQGSDPRALRIRDRLFQVPRRRSDLVDAQASKHRAPTQAFTPSIEVAPNGTLGITHYDLRFNTEDGGATLPTDYWFLHSHDDGAAWSESRITADSFDMRDAPFARGLFTGDYEGLAVQGGNFLTLFSQPHGNDPANTYFTSITP